MVFERNSAVVCNWKRKKNHQWIANVYFQWSNWQKVILFDSFVTISTMVSAWKVSCIISSLVVVQAKDNIHSDAIPNNKSIDQADCDQNSKYPRQVGVKNVCLTKDYSIFDELDENDKPRIHLVFLDKKVAKVDDKKKEITL